MSDLLSLFGAGALLAWIGLPLLAWSATRRDADAPESQQRSALLALVLSLGLLAVPALAARIPHPSRPSSPHAFPSAVAALFTARPVVTQGLSWLALAGLVWLAAVATCALGAAVRAWRLAGLRRRAQLAPTEVVMQAVELSRAAGELPPWVLVSSEARVPFVAGVLRPFVIIPESLLAALEPPALALVIGHELCHLRCGDPWKALVVGFARALLFPHPSARRLVRAWAQAREEAVDARIAAPDPHAYAHLLVDVAAHTSFGRREAFLVSIRSSSLEKRITMLSSTRRPAARSWLLTLVLAAGLAGVGALIPVAHAQGAPATTVQAGEIDSSLTQGSPGGVIVLRIGHTGSVSQRGLSRLAIGDPSVADAKPAGGDTVLITGLSEGKTTLLIWNDAGDRTAFLIDVRP